HQQIKAHREHGEDQHLGREAEIVGLECVRERKEHEGERCDREADEEAAPEAAPRREARSAEATGHCRPNRPVGRTTRMMAIGANTVNNANSGKNALPKLSSNPITRAPTSAPRRLPSPPTITTAKARISVSKSA